MRTKQSQNVQQPGTTGDQDEPLIVEECRARGQQLLDTAARLLAALKRLEEAYHAEAR